MICYTPDIVDIMVYVVHKVQEERINLIMRDTTEKELLEAIKKYKEIYGIKKPLDMFVLDRIIDELRGENK